MAQVRNYTWSAGSALVAGQEFGKVVSASLDISLDDIRAKAGCAIDPWAIEIVNRTISGTVEFQMYSKEAVSQVLGATEASNGYHWVLNEAVTMDAASGNTLANTTGVLADSVIVRANSGKITYKTVDATPADGEVVASTTGSLAWNASDTYDGESVTVSYAYTTAAGEADKLTLAQTDLPSNVELILVGCGRNESSEAKSYVVLRFPKVKFSNLSTSFNQDDFSTWSASFEAFADSNGTICEISSEVA